MSLHLWHFGLVTFPFYSTVRHLFTFFDRNPAVFPSQLHETTTILPKWSRFVFWAFRVASRCQERGARSRAKDGLRRAWGGSDGLSKKREREKQHWNSTKKSENFIRNNNEMMCHLICPTDIVLIKISIWTAFFIRIVTKKVHCSAFNEKHKHL